jgi:hypothetical protein
MNQIDYTNYTSEQLLLDEYFVSSHLNPTSESNDFWATLILNNDALASEIQQAIFFLVSMPHNKAQLTAADEQGLWNQIQLKNELNSNKKQRVRFNYYFTVAASFALLLISTVLYLIKDSTSSNLTAIEKVTKPLIKSQNVELILSDKNVLAIIEEKSELKYNKEGALEVNSKTVQSKSPSIDEELTYNQLIVPPGKQSTINLSDGSKMWVNANSRVVYPVVFDQSIREIYVEGEVFLEVSPDKNRPFIVKTKTLDVDVLGTSFNVSAYENEVQTSVVLVTGEVNVTTKKNESKKLKPNEMYQYADGKGRLRKVNVQNYISWKDGSYIFDRENFVTILMKLGNYYGKEIVVDESLASVYCSGTLNLKNDITMILNGLKNTVSFTYQINENQIKVTPLN